MTTTQHATSTAGTRDEAERHLRALVGSEEARLHDDQWAAIESLVVEQSRVLVVQRTGWGKSAVYFVATALMRGLGAGPTVIISPLLALMRNQIEAAARAGIAAHTINSTNLTEWTEVYDRIREGTIDVLLVSPERLNHPDFRDNVLPKLASATGLVVIDEAHCISDWGHDFRPDYRRLRTLLAGLSPDVPVLATTATANERVTTDVAEQLGDTMILRGELGRASLQLGVVHLPTSSHRLAWLADHLAALPGSGIVYTLTVAGAERTAAFLRSRGHAVLAYSSKTEDAERRAGEEDLAKNQIKALVATSALGMGFDKPDLGFVIHLGAPSSPIAYYQQIGRAGRAVDDAHVLLLPSAEDVTIWRYFSSIAFPPEADVRVVLRELAASTTPMSTQALETVVDLGRGQLEHMLKVLDVDGAVRRVPKGWIATGEPWQHDTVRYARIAAARASEQDAMLAYAATPGCRMEFLRRCLDDPGASACGRCDNCTGTPFSIVVSREALDAARVHADRVGVEITPRVLWPSGLPAIGTPLSGRIAIDERALHGRAIARLSDIGWGERLTRIFDEGLDGPIAADVLAAALRTIDDWPLPDDIRASGVVAIGSRHRPQLIESLARAIAAERDLTFIGTIPPGAPSAGGRANSARSVATLYGSLEAPSELQAALQQVTGPVLLVDDFVDSGWTMTLAARAVRMAGATAVLPFALATSGRRD